jgi:hypothetical protein
VTDIKPANRLNAALAALQTDLPVIAKDQTANAGTYKYKYADLADVSQAIMPLLGKHGLAFTARPTLHDGRFVLRYELRHESGEEIAGIYPLPERGSPQEIGGQITYARRYCLCAVTGVAPADDDDDAAAAQRASQRRQRREDRGGQQSTADDGPRITSQQQRDMQGLFQQLGITDKAERLKFAAAAAGRELRSATELKQAEADKVIATLKQAVDKKAAKAAEATPDPEKDPEGWLASQEPPADHKGVPAR